MVASQARALLPTRPRETLLKPRVRVQASEEDVHDGVVENESTKTNQPQPRSTISAPSPGRSGVNIARKNDPNDECPDFFDVPAPVATPGLLCPLRPGNQRERPEHKAEYVETVSQCFQGVSAGQARHEPRNLAP